MTFWTSTRPKPGWRTYPTKRDADAARWTQRLTKVAAYLAAGNEWPSHNKTDDRVERLLGVWLHIQRVDYRAGRLTAAKEAQLNEVIPGRRQGRPRRGANSRIRQPALVLGRSSIRGDAALNP